MSCGICLQDEFELHDEDCEVASGKVEIDELFTCGRCGTPQLEWFRDNDWPSIVPDGIWFLCLRCYAVVKLAYLKAKHDPDNGMSPRDFHELVKVSLGKIQMGWGFYARRALEDYRRQEC